MVESIQKVMYIFLGSLVISQQMSVKPINSRHSSRFITFNVDKRSVTHVFKNIGVFNSFLKVRKKEN